MKKQVLTVALLMVTFVTSAQVGVGTLDPNQSAQLDVVANDKGVLIPRVSLTDVTDTTTITNGNVASLLVYNTTSNETITPGYYYWYEDKWRKLLIAQDLINDVLTLLSYDKLTNTLAYTDEMGSSHSFILNNTKNSSIVLNGSILTVTDTDGNSIPVDLAALINTTKVAAGTNVTITGTGSGTTPYTINSKNTTNANFSLNATTNVLTLVDSDNNSVQVDLTNFAKNTTIVNVSFDPVTNNITITDSDNNTDVVDISGVLKAKNGLHVSTDKNVVLGGSLTENTTIGTTGFDLNIQDLPQVASSANRKVMMVDDTTGKLNVATTKQLVDQATNVDVTTADNMVTVTVNGRTDSDTVVKTNNLTVNGSTLTSTINGVSSSIDLDATITSTQKTTTVSSGTNTTVTPTIVGKNTDYKVDVATANATNLGVVKQAATNPTVFINAAGELSASASALNNIIEVSANYPIASNDVVVLGNATSDITITLPSAAGIKGRKLTIKKSDAANTTYVNVVSAGGTIDGETDLYTSLPYSGWDFMSDGTNWKIVNKF